MFKPELYQKINVMQRLEVKAVLNKHPKIFNWKNDGTEAVLDFGTGPGDITSDYILTLMPKNFDRVVGADISSTMVEYSQREFGTDKLEFKVMDAAKDVQKYYPDMYERFDVFTSFFCVHFIKEQEAVWKNIFSYLKPGGRCLVSCVKTFTLFDGFLALSELKKYEEHKEKIQSMTPYFYFVEDTEIVLTKMLEKFGFTDVKVGVHANFFFYELENWKDHVRSVHPLVNLNDDKIIEETVDDFVTFMEGEKLITDDKKTATAKYNLITVTAYKPTG